MSKRTWCAVIAGVLLAMQAPAQSAALPQTYAFTATSNMMGPMTIKVNRNGSKELIELAGAPGGFHLRVLYDFQAHRIFTVDLAAKNQCSTQQYGSAYAPVLHDPIGGAEEMAREAGSLRTIGRENVNGISARVVEAPMAEGQGKFKLWLEEKFGFPVKQAMSTGTEPQRLLFEMRQLSYAASDAALFVEPAGCVRIAGTTNANGGSAEMSVDVTAQGQVNLGSAPPANRAAQRGGTELLGKWEFNGKDGAGVQWGGELTIEKLPPDSYGTENYSNMCDLNLSAGNAGKGMSGPCLYDSQSRKFSFAGGQDSSKFSFTAVLSPDGKRLTQGRWVESAPANGGWSAASKTGAPARR